MIAMDAEDLLQLFLPHQAAKLIAGTKDPAMVEALISDALQVGLIAVTTYAAIGYTSGPFPASAEIQGGIGLVDYMSQRAAKELEEAAAGGATPTHIHALRATLLRRVDKAGLQIHRTEIARWIRHMNITSAYQFDQQPPVAAAPAVRQHSTKTAQRDEADVFIDAALAAVGQDADVAAVWSWLQTIADAKDKPGTLLGVDAKGLNYVRSGIDAWMNRDALSRRLKRRRAP